MAKRPGNRLIQSDAASAGRAQARQADTWIEREQARRGTLSLSAVRSRPEGDSRSLKPGHVLNLAESIAALGLVEPPTVDCAGHLLAGAHRIAALKLLALSNIEARVEQWLELCQLSKSRLTAKQQLEVERLKTLSSLETEEVPVMILPFNAAEDPARALAIETSENTQRRPYSKDEILTLVQRLRAAGFVEREGRPRAGEKALRPALSVVLGKSGNTVRRWLGVLEDAPKTCPNGHVSKVQQAEYRLVLAIRNYRRALSENSLEINHELQNKLAQLESLLH
ncbi:MAG TPA: ParB N-terminal domain-containing protein [Candidatus Competibacteraceae bacterium]|nr:ParB N-terminal domain-containing protein [Candidatus Competibacteraceae bacterium]HPF59948.1 ParB N-terminal domain-containing protein [Candidatus Competibacteraceae bacterium]HRY19133.1 ParB N-terminal domain-containing protein [Candidatus Competibacteraceae bacterium]